MHSDPMSVDYTIIVGEHITPAWRSLCATMIAETALNTPIFAVVFSASEAEGPHKRLQGDMGFPYRTWKENKSFDGEVWFAWLSPLSLRINRNFKYQERKCMAEACREPHLGLKWGWWRNRAAHNTAAKPIWKTREWTQEKDRWRNLLSQQIDGWWFPPRRDFGDIWKHQELITLGRTFGT